MGLQSKTKEELILDFKELKHRYDSLQAKFEKELSDKESEKAILTKLINASEEFIHFTDVTPDYNKILKTILEISGAKFAAFNVFDSNGLDFTSVAFEGINEHILNTSSYLGFELVGKHWQHDPLRAEKIKKRTITRFEHLHELTNNIISKSIVYLLENTFNIGEVFIVKIVKESKAIGDFTLLFNKGETLKNKKFVDLYAHLVGMFLDTKKGTDLLHFNEARHIAMISGISDVIAIVGADEILQYVSPNIKKSFGWDPQDLVGADTWLPIYSGDREMAKSRLYSLLKEDNSSITVELRYLCKNGSVRPIKLSAINLNKDPLIKGVLVNFHDITERKKTEELLQQTRDNYETFFNTIDDFLFVLDQQGNIIHTNSTVISRLGYSSEELYNNSVLKIYPPESQSEASHIIGEMLIGLAEFCPIQLITKSGVLIPVETRVTHGFWDGKPVIFGVSKDITNIKLSEEKFSTLFYLNPSACGLTDLETVRYLEVNDAFYNLFGFDKNEVIGKTAMDLGLLNLDSLNDLLLKIQERGSAYNIEANLRAKNGDIKNVLLSAEDFSLQDKNFRFTVVSDVTELMQTEKMLERSKEQIRQILQTTDQGIYGIDLDGNCTFINAAGLNILGYNNDECLGMNMHDLVHHSFADGSHYPVADCPIFLAKISGESCHLDTEVMWRKDGTAFPSEYSSYPIVENGKITGVVITFFDITKRKLIEQNIKIANEELKITNAEKDKFFSIISHDLKTPFTGFLGLTKMMADELSSMTTDEIKEIVYMMRDSATNLYRLLGNLLEWSRMQRGLIPFEPSEISVRSIVSESVSFVKDSADKKEIVIETDIPLDLIIFADERMIGTVIRNLVSNSVKFSLNGGKIFVAARKLSDDSVEISVKDEGIGMSKAIVDSLFSLDNNKKREGTAGESSTGLGLLICKDFIEKHGGTIHVESKEGKGSVFSFSIFFET